MSSEPTYHCEVADGSFKMWFVAPRQLLLLEDWDKMVWDECLRQAHSRGVIPIGSVMVGSEECPPQTALTEGVALSESISMGLMMATADVIKVTAEVMVGTSL